MPAKPFLSGLLVNAERIEPLRAYDGDVILRQVPSNTKEITLSHSQNFITFEVTDPDLSDPDPEFHYMLEGLDGGWRKASAADIRDRKLTTTYTAVPPGYYRFRVRLSDKTDAPEATMEVKVKHPWWGTVTARIIYLLLAVAAIVGGLRLYALRTRKKIMAEERRPGCSHASVS